MTAFKKLLNLSGSRPKRLPLLFECLLCHNRFTSEDVESKKFYARTLICKECYIEGSKAHPKVWCFGKLPARNSPGYSEDNISCRLLCPDRAVCVKFIKKLKLKEK